MFYPDGVHNLNAQYRTLSLWIKEPRRRFLVGISVIPLPKIDGGGLTEPPSGLLCLLIPHRPVAPFPLHEKIILPLVLAPFFAANVLSYKWL